jgi:hypothetical protein
MISFFPDPYPDELLYSVCARYQERVQYQNSRHSIEELFGAGTQTVVVAIPNHLGRLVSVLPFGHHYTVDRLINENTLLPFFSPFLEPKRITLLRENMQGDSGRLAQMHLGFITSSIRLPEWFRFCPLCAEEDKKQLGECYWHRLHQLPGVEVCPVHKVFLVNSEVRTRSQRLKYELICAENAVKVVQPNHLDLSNSCHEALLKIARDAIWLLSQSSLILEFSFVKNRYLYLLKRRGLANYTGIVRVKELLEAFRNYYPGDFLKLLNCEIDEQKQTNWLVALVRPSVKWMQPPLYHLLLIQFLEYTAEQFFTLAEDVCNPFGEGPWPCLNPVCEHFGQPYIEDISYRCRGDQVIGIFSCACGFIYSRNSHNQSSADCFRFSQVKSYGWLWEDTLKQLWNDSAISISEIARYLGINRETVKNQAGYLGLSFPRLGPIAKVKPLSQVVSPRPRNIQAPRLNKVQTNRNKRSSSGGKYREFFPFGEGPWPCLNPVCEHFRQPRIKDITYKYQEGKFRGIFGCICGFVYFRTKSDKVPEDPFRFSRVKSYGSLWENALRQLWNDSALSLSEVVRRLGVDDRAVKREASRLGLSFPRIAPSYTVEQGTQTLSSRSRDSKILQNKLKIYRSKWIDAIEEYPGAGRSFLCKKFKRIYSWLYRHDKEWLIAHLPSPQKIESSLKSLRASRVDWKSLDTQLAEAVKLSALALKNTATRPVRVTKIAIANDLGRLSLGKWIIIPKKRQFDKLPLTANALAEAIETPEEVAIRKIWWVTNCYRKERIHPTRSQLRKRSGVNSEIAQLAQVKNALDAAWQSLEPLKIIGSAEILPSDEA